MRDKAKRLLPLCVCAALTMTLMTTFGNAARAEGNSDAFPAKTASLHGIATPMDMPRPKRLLFEGVSSPSVQNNPEQLYPARATLGGRFSNADLACMAEALYFEARGESRQGQQAVAEVILNRVDSRVFPRTVCGVVNQPSQFSYTIGGKKKIRNKAAYARALRIAEAALAGGPRNLTDGATYFHTPAVRPAWSHRFQRTVRIGSHIFYRSGQRMASN